MDAKPKLKASVKTDIKRSRGRPVKHTMPEPIPDTPENIARAVLGSPRKPPGGWKYLDTARKGEPKDG